jgi:para-aminobenzoate synthetase component 1
MKKSTGIMRKVFDYQGDGMDLAQAFQNERYLFFLDSSRVDPVDGRYSFIGFDPFDVYRGSGKKLLGKLKEKYETLRGKSKYTSEIPFVSGIVGYLSYDYGLAQEKIKLQRRETWRIPEAVFGFYDRVLVIDHLKHKLILLSTGLSGTKKSSHQKKARQKFDQVMLRVEKILAAREIPPLKRVFRRGSFPNTLSFKANLSKNEYKKSVKRVLRYIEQGDAYQVNLSQRFEFDVKQKNVQPVYLYRVLRDLSPSCFGGFFDAGNFQIISSSPERFLSFRGRVVQAKPMKGTRPRGEDSKEDLRLRDDILKSKKDRAELLMITDLERNDLGKVCEFGSVQVKTMREIEEYATVFQATSTIEGKLRRDKDCFDLISACFPGGSITGCPKIRAMEIIEELEPTRRGIYTGCLGYIDFNGRMDFNILIRTLLLYKDKLYYQVGGGVVADSDPEKEYEETLVKAKAMRQALESVYGT